MSWRRALRDTARPGLTVERTRLEPLVAVRGAAGLAIVIAVSLWAFGPVVAANTAVPPMALDGTAGTVPDEPAEVRNPGSP